MMKNLFYILPFALLISCSGKNNSNMESDKLPETNSGKQYLELSQEQIEMSGIQTGKLEKRTISETVECSGNLVASPEDIATVSPLINGYIKNLNYYPGDYVEKGTVLGTLNHPDFITLQQQYIEAKSQVDYYQEEFKRQGELTVENAASIKKMQRAQADYLSYEATYKSLKAQFELLGVNTEKIEKGDFVKDFIIKAPISGTISRLNANKGKFVSAEDYIYEIVNTSVLNIKLNVFEKDFSKIKVGQTIRFHNLNNERTYISKVKRTGVKLNDTDKSILVQGVIENKSGKLKSGMYVNASILTNEKETYTVPTTAVVESTEKSFIFIKEKNAFKAIEIEKGIEQPDFCEIIDPDKELLHGEIVINGAYYLMSKMEAEE